MLICDSSWMFCKLPLRLPQAYDQKNIRRRVYDALNVLMAMNIISKEKKEIKWIGLPTNSAQECQNLEVHCQPFMFCSETVPQAVFLKQVVLLSAALVPARVLCCLCLAWTRQTSVSLFPKVSDWARDCPSAVGALSVRPACLGCADTHCRWGGVRPGEGSEL